MRPEGHDSKMDTRAEEEAEGLTCKHCGHSGPDVELRTEYVGGHGFMEFPKCTDSMACWRRWDGKNL